MACADGFELPFGLFDTLIFLRGIWFTLTPAPLDPPDDIDVEASQRTFFFFEGFITFTSFLANACILPRTVDPDKLFLPFELSFPLGSLAELHEILVAVVNLFSFDVSNANVVEGRDDVV